MSEKVVTQRLMDWFKSKKISLAEVAKATGITPNTLSNYKTGANTVSLKSLYKIKKAFPELDLPSLFRDDAKGVNEPSQKYNVGNPNVFGLNKELNDLWGEIVKIKKRLDMD